MSLKDYIIKVKTELETTGFIKKSDEAVNALDKIANSLDKSKRNANGFSKSIENITTRIRSFTNYKIASTVINGITNAIHAGVKSAVDLEKEFANIQAITGATDATMGKLRDTILRVGQASKYSTEEIAKSTVQLGQAGLSAEEINDVLETTTQLAAATGSELSNTVDLMTSSLAVWGLNSEEAAHLSDVMVTGMNRTKATLDTFRMSVQYAGATAASLNVNFEELAAVSSAAANAGLRASVVGTGLRAVMAELISPTKKMVEGLKEMGLNTSDVDIASRGLVPVLRTLRDAGLDASNAYDMFGRRAATFVLAAQGQLDKIDELQLAFTEQGATLKAYGIQMDTISAQATALGNTIKSIASDVLDHFRGMIVGFLKFVNKALQGLRYVFSDRSKLNFKDDISSLENDTKSTSAFSNYLDRIKDGLDKDAEAGKKLDNVIKQINKQFDTNIDYVDSSKKIADEWERISSAIDKIDEEKIKEINSTKAERESALLDKAVSALRGPSKTVYVKDSSGMYKPKLESGEFFQGKITETEFKNKVSDFIKTLREEGDYSKLEDAISESSEGAERTITKRAVDTAKRIYEEIGDFAVSKLHQENLKEITEEISSGRSKNLGSGGAKVPQEKVEDYDKNLQESMLRNAWTGKPEVKSEWAKGVEGFSEQVQKMKDAYTSANIGATIAEDLGDGMSDALYSISNGTKSMKEAFKDLARSVLEEIQKMIIKMLVLKALEAGVGLFSGGGEITESGGVTSSGSFNATAANGGFAARLRAAAGSLVRGGVQGRDSVPAVLMPGEYVLKKSAVDALGTNFLNDLNNNAAQTLTNTAASMMEQNPWESQESEPAVVNVWVVSKEEEAKIGPNDIIATIGKDIMTGGQTKRLIQSVVAGRK